MMINLYSKVIFFIPVFLIISLSNCKNANQTDSIGQTSDPIVENQIPVKDSGLSEKSIQPLPSWPEKAKQQKGKRFPFDEAVRDTSLVALRAQIYMTVIEKNTKQLLSFIADDIKFSFGAENGKADFIKTWELDTKPGESTLWNELSATLKLGGGFGSWGSDHFYAPYIFVLEDIDDPYTQAIVTGKNVRLRAAPDSKSEILGSLSWDLVEILDQAEFISETIGGESHVWQKVKTESGQTGFVYEKYLRTSVDYRAGFVKEDGKWIMELFIAGD